MKIIKTKNNHFQLRWEYSIKNNKTIKNDREYYFYNCVFPAELADYYEQKKELWIYREEGKNYITNIEPASFKSKKIKLFNKGNPQRAKDMTLSKKFFKELEGLSKGKAIYILHVDEEDIYGVRGKLEIKLKLD